MLVNLKDWAEIDIPQLVLLGIIALRGMWKDYLAARYGAGPPSRKDDAGQDARQSR